MTERTKCEVFDGCSTCGDDMALKIDASVSHIDNMHNDSLLFRIWDTKENIMMYPDFSELGVTFGPSPDGVHYPKNASDFLFDICAWDGNRYIAEKCTGIRDRAKRLIYENDEFLLNNITHRIIYIERNASFFILNLQTGDVYGMNDSRINISEDISICGNIHNY